MFGRVRDEYHNVLSFICYLRQFLVNMIGSFNVEQSQIIYNTLFSDLKWNNWIFNHATEEKYAGRLYFIEDKALKISKVLRTSPKDDQWRNINGISIGAAINEAPTETVETFQSLPHKETNERVHGVVEAAEEEDIHDEPEAAQLGDIEAIGAGMEEFGRDGEAPIYRRSEEVKDKTHAGLSGLQIQATEEEQVRYSSVF